MSIQEKGTVTFWLKHEHPDWDTNNNGYNFKHADDQTGITIEAQKRPDKTLAISLGGTIEKKALFLGPMPKVEKPKGLFVAVSWSKSKIQLYLNDKLVQDINLDQAGGKGNGKQ